jgi:hypothetical protein
MHKRDIINFLFVISFPVYGVGTYFSAISSPSAGYIISILPLFLIMLFYFVDLLYKGEFKIRLNGYYFLMSLFILSSIASLFIALAKGLPEASLIQTVTKSILLFVPFQAFLIAALYNEEKENMLRLTLIGLSALLFINLVGFFGLGMSNAGHSIEGRINFPFLDGFYSWASLLAIINLLLLHYLKRTWKYPVYFSALSAYFVFNFVIFFMINSRLSILIFALVATLWIFGAIRVKGVFLLSMFTIPILLTSGIIIYKILQLPGLSFLLQRVDIEDVTTFNGRAFLWRDAMDWLMNDQQGLLFGNGYKGHYFMGLISDVAKLWNEKEVYHMHLHSTSLETLVSQGVVFFLLFAVLFYLIYTYYKRKNKEGAEEGAFLPVVIYLLFIMQVDTFVYLDNLGFIIFSLLLSKIVIDKKANENQGLKITERTTLLDYTNTTRQWGAVAFHYDKIKNP